jgi:hypothetical protein
MKRRTVSLLHVRYMFMIVGYSKLNAAKAIWNLITENRRVPPARSWPEVMGHFSTS